MMRILGAMMFALSLGCDGSPTTGSPAQVIPEPSGPVVEQPSTFSATVTIDAGIVHQQMMGFGASMRIFSDPHMVQGTSASDTLRMFLTDQEAILDSVYKSIGLTRVRAVIQSNGTQPTPQSTPRRDWVYGDGHIALIKRAQTKGLLAWWMSPLTLETWMNASNVSQYADWAMSEIRYWKSQGVELTWYSVLNEPQLSGISGEFVRDAVKLIGRQLVAEGFKTRLVIPDDVNPLEAAKRAQIVLSDPEARGYVVALATHIYGVNVSSTSALATVAAQYKLPLWMTEFSVDNHSPMAWADIVHHLIADNNVSAVDYMWGYFGDWDRAQLVSLHYTPSRQFTGLTMNPAAYAMAQYARFVLPTAKRVELVSSSHDVLATAFVHDGKISIVALNEGSAPVSVKFVVSGASNLRNLDLIRTSDTEHLSSIGHLVITNGAFNVDLPAQSISTFVQ